MKILLDESVGGTQITIVHTNIPEGQAERYKQGWDEFYFTHMRKYFSQD